jgi:hypothetical protein
MVLLSGRFFVAKLVKSFGFRSSAEGLDDIRFEFSGEARFFAATKTLRNSRLHLARHRDANDVFDCVNVIRCLTCSPY